MFLSDRSNVRTLVCVLVALMAMGACKGPSEEEKAAQAACEYFQRLAEGDTDGFMACKAGADSLSPAYAEQLLAAAGKYRDELQLKHGGIGKVAISDHVAYIDTLQSPPVMMTFLMLTFNDSTQEEIVVPLVLSNGQWLMK